MITAKDRFYYQKKGSRSRGIEFKLNFDEWYNWWLSNGIDKNLPTENKKDQLCMCRVNDTGPYSLDNIYCATRAQNIKDARKIKYWNNTRVTPVVSLPVNPRNLGHKTGSKLVTPAGKFSTRNEALSALRVSLSRLRKLQIEEPERYHWEKA
jgi:hypothetical protein